MARSVVIGVDPGVDGAIAVLHRAANFLSVHIHKMPTLTVKVGKSERRRVDLLELHKLGAVLALSDPAITVIEDVQGYGQQNAAAAFVFGRATCAVEMAFIAAECPLHYVTPQRWKKALGLSADKANAVLEAQRLYPSCAALFKPVRGEITTAQTIGAAEALLLAHYGLVHVLRQ